MTVRRSFRALKNYYKIQEAYQRFINNSWSGGIVLIVFTVIAMILANMPHTKELYHKILETHLSIGFDNFKADYSIVHWVNDGLMVLFFFYVGLDIKRQLMVGQLSTVKGAILPAAAALGGIAVPAAIYLLFNGGGEYEAGWAIPMSTDIAFAIGVLSLLGSRVPVSLKIFLTALAIVDDLGAIIVIAIFYSSQINFLMLGLALVIVALLILFNRNNVYNMGFYLIPSIVLWILFLYSGVHATISGVLIAMTIPATPRYSKSYLIHKTRFMLHEFCHYDKEGVPLLANSKQTHVLFEKRKMIADAISPLQRIEHILDKVVAFIIMPVFALANAGVEVAGGAVSGALTSPQGLGIFFGLVLGKPVGIMLFSYLSTKAGIAKLPDNIGWDALLTVAILGGVGFTMSIFIDGLAFTDPAHVASGKISILVASVVAAVIGVTYGRIVLSKKKIG